MPWLRYVFYVLVLISSFSSLYLYNYATIKGCYFPAPNKHVPTLIERFLPNEARQQAPFRLLALGDPQLEGDTSIDHVTRKSYKWPALRNNLRHRDDKIKVLSEAITDLFLFAIPVAAQNIRKRLDLLGNDYYLAHIYRTLQRQTNPTHVTVLGDLLGSQWIDDAEFERRAGRYWNRVFANGIRAEDDLTKEPTIEVLGEDKRWRRRIINIAGNHDVGYAAELTKERIARFEKAFGAANWEVVFQVPGAEDELAYLRLIILNTMNLDTQALDEDLQKQTYEFINDVINNSEPVENRSVGTILLTHIPMHKKEGICFDSPYFSFDWAGRVREQNHLSEYASKSLLEGVFGLSGNPAAPYNGLGRKGIILNGHDHEGCDVWHHLPRVMPEEDIDTRQWDAKRWNESFMLARASTNEYHGQYGPGIREVTLRSMMGEYGGWGYLLSAWVDPKTKEWQFEVNTCSAGIQHIWWAVHIVLLITAGVGGLLAFLAVAQPTSKVKPAVLPQKEHRKIPSIELPPVVEEPTQSTSPPLRPPSPFDHFTSNMQLSGGRARRRKPG